jgi:hypothetical protein
MLMGTVMMMVEVYHKGTPEYHSFWSQFSQESECLNAGLREGEPYEDPITAGVESAKTGGKIMLAIALANLSLNAYKTFRK